MDISKDILVPSYSDILQNWLRT